MTVLFALGMLLLQDSTELARLQARLEGQPAARVRVDREYVELTRPRLLDTAITYRSVWFERIEMDDSTLVNPLPLAQVSLVQVRGKAVIPAVIRGSLSIGLSALASAVLTKAINPDRGPDGQAILSVALIGFGAGAALGAADGALRLRWVTIYKRRDAETPRRRGSF